MQVQYQVSGFEYGNFKGVLLMLGFYFAETGVLDDKGQQWYSDGRRHSVDNPRRYL